MKKIEAFVESVRKLFDPNFSKMELEQLMGRWELDKNVRRKKLVESEIVERIKKYSYLELLNDKRYISDGFVEFFDQELSRKLKLLRDEIPLDLHSHIISICCDKSNRKFFARFPESLRIAEDVYKKMLPNILKECDHLCNIVYYSFEGKYELAIKHLRDMLPGILGASDVEEIVRLYWALQPSLPKLAQQVKESLEKNLKDKDRVLGYSITYLLKRGEPQSTGI
jgi:hypothetical protein